MEFFCHINRKPISIESRDKTNLSAAGSDKRVIIARLADCKLHAGDHSFFNISRHISPV